MNALSGLLSAFAPWREYRYNECSTQNPLTAQLGVYFFAPLRLGVNKNIIDSTLNAEFKTRLPFTLHRLPLEESSTFPQPPNLA